MNPHAHAHVMTSTTVSQTTLAHSTDAPATGPTSHGQMPRSLPWFDAPATPATVTPTGHAERHPGDGAPAPHTPATLPPAPAPTPAPELAPEPTLHLIVRPWRHPVTGEIREYVWNLRELLDAEFPQTMRGYYENGRWFGERLSKRQTGIHAARFTRVKVWRTVDGAWHTAGLSDWETAEVRARAGAATVRRAAG